MAILNSSRLTLKPVVEEDLEAILRIQTDREVLKAMRFKKLTLDDQKKWFQSLGNSTLAFSVFRNGFNESRELVGLATVNNIDHHHKRASWGLKFKIGEQNHGFGYEASLLLMNYCFTKLGLHKMFGDSITENIASRKMCKKIGLTEDGILRQHFNIDGKFHDLVYFGILKEEFYERNQTILETLNIRIEP